MDPAIDPATGKPKDPPATPEYVPIADFNAIKQRLDAFEAGTRFSQPPPSSTPPAPSGPSVSDQLSGIDKQIEAIDTQIDDAVKDGKPISKLNRERDALREKAIRLRIKSEDIDPAMSLGVQTIDQLSDQITRGSMKHLSVPEIKKAYEQALGGLDASQRMNPQMRQAAYNIAVGQHIDKVLEIEKEAMLRADATPPPEPGSAGTGRHDADTSWTPDPKKPPKPEDVLSPGAMKALATKGVTADQYYTRKGYKGGWPEYWEKVGYKYHAPNRAA